MGASGAARAGTGTRKRRATPRVADLMRREFISVPPEETLLDAHRTMRLARLRHLLVVENGVLVGILSYRDLQDAVVERGVREDGVAWHEALHGVSVREAMVALPYCVRPETPADEAARRMLRLRLGCLPVCENEALQLVGLLSESDLLRAAWK